MVMIMHHCINSAGQNKSRIALNGRILLRKPRLDQSCSAEEEEEV
jgi:hypothetical protein